MFVLDKPWLAQKFNSQSLHSRSPFMSCQHKVTIQLLTAEQWSLWVGFSLRLSKKADYTPLYTAVGYVNCNSKPHWGNPLIYWDKLQLGCSQAGPCEYPHTRLVPHTPSNSWVGERPPLIKDYQVPELSMLCVEERLTVCTPHWKVWKHFVSMVFSWFFISF